MPRLFVSLCLVLASLVAFADDEPAHGNAPPVRCLAFSPDGRLLAAAGADRETNGELVIWDVATLQPLWRHSESVGFPKVAFSPDGKQLALSRFAPETKLFGAASGDQAGELKGHANHARCVTYSPDGERIITGSHDKTIMVWDARTKECIATLAGHMSPVYHVTVSPNGKLLASADGRAYQAHLWDLGSGQKRWSSDRLESHVPHVAFSPDGNLLAVSSWGGHLSLYDARTHKQLRRIRNLGGVRWAEFSADGRWLAVVSSSLRVHVFKADATADPELQQRIAGLFAKFEDDSYVVREEASRDLAEIGPAAEAQLREAMQSTSVETRIRGRTLFRRLSEPESATQLRGHTDELQCVTFSSDSKFLATGDDGGNVIVWSVGDWGRKASLTLGDK